MPVSKMWESIEALIQASLDHNGGVPRGSGKKFLHNVIPGADFNSLWTETWSIPG